MSNLYFYYQGGYLWFVCKCYSRSSFTKIRVCGLFLSCDKITKCNEKMTVVCFSEDVNCEICLSRLFSIEEISIFSSIIKLTNYTSEGMLDYIESLGIFFIPRGFLYK